MSTPETYVFTDIEADGFVPGLHSMISFGCVAYSEDRKLIGSFEVNLKPLSGATQDPNTMEWWKTEPIAWEYCNTNQEDPEKAIPRYREWIRSLPGKPILVAHPATFDFMWIAWYLLRFCRERTFGPAGLDIKSYAMATLGWKFSECDRSVYPSSWLGDITHTHKPLDDAMGYAQLFFRLQEMNKILHKEAMVENPKSV